MNEYYAIVISTISILLAAFALGWNVYRDLLLKSRLRVTFMLVDIVGSGLPNPIPKISRIDPVKIRMINPKISIRSR